MDRSALPRELRPFVDDAGRLVQWPVRQKVQRQAMDYISTRFETGREYSEREVNDLLREWHTFGDWALLRRMLYDWGYVTRERDGSRYRVIEREDPEALKSETGN
jgi:hypothetical protein